MDKMVLLALVVLFAVCGRRDAASASCSEHICTCDSVDNDGEGDVLTEQEGLAAAVGVLTPLVLGGACVGLYQLLTSPSASMESRGSGPLHPNVMSRDSPRPYLTRPRGGSSPVSMFSDDDEATFNPPDDDGWNSPRPDTSSAYTNIHRASKADSINRWM